MIHFVILSDCLTVVESYSVPAGITIVLKSLYGRSLTNNENLLRHFRLSENLTVFLLVWCFALYHDSP